MKSFKDHIKEAFAPVKAFRDATKHYQKFDTRDEFQGWRGSADELMAQFGFHYNGSGKSAAVYSNPKYPYVIKLFMRDAPYLKWLHFCQHNQHNPYVPKIKGKVMRIGDLFMAVRLEKLYTYSPKGGYAFASDQIDDAAMNGDKNASDVYAFFDANANLLDLHNGNFMYRHKPVMDQVVCIDPFYNWFKGGQFTMDPDDISAFKSLF